MSLFVALAIPYRLRRVAGTCDVWTRPVLETVWGAVLLGLVGILPLFVFLRPWSALALVALLPFTFGLGLPVCRSFLRFDVRDPLLVPFSVLSGIVAIGTAHLALLHLGARALTLYALVAAGAASLWAYRHDIRELRPQPNLAKAALLVLLLYPQLSLQFRAWSKLVQPDGSAVHFFNRTQAFNVGILWDIAGGIPLKSSYTYPLVGTYHLAGHAWADFVRNAGSLTPFEAYFIVLSLFVVGLGEIVLLWLMARWFCRRFLTKALLLGALVYLSGEAVRVFLVRKKLIPATWLFGGDETGVFSFPHPSTNIPRMMSVLVALWILYVIFERVRQGRAADVKWAIVLGGLLGSLYYYKTSALVTLLPGFALASFYRAYRDRESDLCLMLGVATIVGALIHLAIFSFGGRYGIGTPLYHLRTWGVPGGTALAAASVYLLGWNFRAIGLVVALGELRDRHLDGLFTSLALLLAGALVVGIVVANVVTHSIPADAALPRSGFYGYYVPVEGGFSAHSLNFRQFVHVPHALLSVLGFGFLAHWIECGRTRALGRLVVGGALALTIAACITVTPRAFGYVQKSNVGGPELLAAVSTIPREGSLIAANFMDWSAAALQGHHFYLQANVFFNYGSNREALHERADREMRLFSSATSDGEKRALLSLMNVTDLLIDKEAVGRAEFPGCRAYYENQRYSVCRVAAIAPGGGS